jgi:hypothetical protein
MNQEQESGPEEVSLEDFSLEMSTRAELTDDQIEDVRTALDREFDTLKLFARERVASVAKHYGITITVVTHYDAGGTQTWNTARAEVR